MLVHFNMPGAFSKDVRLLCVRHSTATRRLDIGVSITGYDMNLLHPTTTSYTTTRLLDMAN